MAPQRRTSDEAIMGKYDGRTWSCQKCGEWSWADRSTCFKCGLPPGKKRNGERGAVAGKQSATLTVGDFILVGKGKKDKKKAKALERQLARLREFEAKEAAGTGKGAEPDPGKDEATSICHLEEKLACFTKWGDSVAAAAVAQELEAKRKKTKAASPESCDRNVKRLRKLLDDKGASADRLQRDADAAKEAAGKLAEELVAAEAEQCRVAKEYSQRIAGTNQDGLPTVQLSKLLSGGQAFHLDTGELFDLEGTDIEITEEEAAEIEKRKVGLEEGLQQLATQFFETITTNIKAAKEELAEDARKRCAKKRKTDQAQDGAGGSTEGLDAETVTPAVREEAKNVISEGGPKSFELASSAGACSGGSGSSKPNSTAEAKLEEAKARARASGTKAN